MTHGRSDAASETLQGDYPYGLWKEASASGGSQEILTVTPLHAGARLKAGGAAPPPKFWSLSQLPAWSTGLLSALGLLAVTAALERLSHSISRRSASAGSSPGSQAAGQPDLSTAATSGAAAEPPCPIPSNGSPRESTPLLRPPVADRGHNGADSGALNHEWLRFNRQIAELESRAGPLSADEWSAAQRDLLKERAVVRTAFADGRISPKEAQVLFKALRNIHAELEFLKPDWQQPTRRKLRSKHVKKH